MEKELNRKLDSIMGRPGVIGVVCADKQGLCLSGKRSPSPRADGGAFEISDSSEEEESPKTPTRKAAIRDEILSSSVRTASYNIVFQIFVRIFTFVLNAFILRSISHDVLGICNVRLALLYSSVLFLSREPFRRACLRKTERSSWEQAINLIWIALPLNIFWAFVFGYIWCYVLSQPEGQVLDQYQQSVWLMSVATVLDSASETPYIIGQYFQYSKLRIVGDTTLIVCRSLFLLFAVISYPQYAIAAYALGTLLGTILVGLIYFGFFYHEITKKSALLPFNSLSELFPNVKNFQVPQELKSLAMNFFKQSLLKQVLTEGERYMMTFFDLLAFKEQGVYDLVANLGSLAARFIFQPIEESSYLYFARTLQKRSVFTRHDRELPQNTAKVLGNLFRIMLVIGLIMISYGIPFSNTVLYLYGGENLSRETGSGTILLQANCAYILFIALNGVLEAFTFAIMGEAELERFNRKLIIFSGVFLLSSFVFTRLLGPVGFFLANSLNMALRIGQSIFIIQRSFFACDVNPFREWALKRLVVAAFSSAFVLNMLMGSFNLGRIVHVSIGLFLFAVNCLAIAYSDKKLFYFFCDLYKVKTA